MAKHTRSGAVYEDMHPRPLKRPKIKEDKGAKEDHVVKEYNTAEEDNVVKEDDVVKEDSVVKEDDVVCAAPTFELSSRIPGISDAIYDKFRSLFEEDPSNSRCLILEKAREHEILPGDDTTTVERSKDRLHDISSALPYTENCSLNEHVPE